MTVLPHYTHVHFHDGETLDVHTDPPTTSRLLWGTDDGDDAHDTGYAALQAGGRVHHVYPAEVLAIQPI